MGRSGCDSQFKAVPFYDVSICSAKTTGGASVTNEFAIERSLQTSDSKKTPKCAPGYSSRLITVVEKCRVFACVRLPETPKVYDPIPIQRPPYLPAHYAHITTVDAYLEGYMGSEMYYRERIEDLMTAEKFVDAESLYVYIKNKRKLLIFIIHPDDKLLVFICWCLVHLPGHIKISKEFKQKMVQFVLET